MKYQPTLSEILADDTGNIRAEIADLLMEPHDRPLRNEMGPNAQRRQVAYQNRPQPQPSDIDWVVIVSVVLLGFILGALIDAFVIPTTFHASLFEDSETRDIAKPATESAPVPDIQEETKSQAVGDNGQDNGESAVKGEGSSESDSEMQTEKIGRVIGDNVRLRTQPNLEGDIIQMVHQNEILIVLSSHDGWHEIAMSDQSSAYIFGAYLVLQDFDSSITDGGEQ